VSFMCNVRSVAFSYTRQAARAPAVLDLVDGDAGHQQHQRLPLEYAEGAPHDRLHQHRDHQDLRGALERLVKRAARRARRQGCAPAQLRRPGRSVRRAVPAPRLAPLHRMHRLTPGQLTR